MENQKLISLAIEGLELRRQSIVQEIGELETMQVKDGPRKVRPNVDAIGQAKMVANPKSGHGSKRTAWTPERRRQQSEAMKMAWQKRSERARQAFRHRRPA